MEGTIPHIFINEKIQIKTLLQNTKEQTFLQRKMTMSKRVWGGFKVWSVELVKHFFTGVERLLV